MKIVFCWTSGRDIDISSMLFTQTWSNIWPFTQYFSNCYILFLFFHFDIDKWNIIWKKTETFSSLLFLQSFSLSSLRSRSTHARSRVGEYKGWEKMARKARNLPDIIRKMALLKEMAEKILTPINCLFILVLYIKLSRQRSYMIFSIEVTEVC